MYAQELPTLVPCWFVVLFLQRTLTDIQRATEQISVNLEGVSFYKAYPGSNKIKLETSNKKSSKSPQTFGNKMTHK